LLPAAMVISSAHAQGAAESTLARIQRTKVLRIAALPGQLPYFNKDIVTGKWSGSCIEMANSIAQVFGAKLDYVEATYGTSVLDLQTNKVDLAFCFESHPAARAIDRVYAPDDHSPVWLPGKARA
jgi:polar amino acid transport system substrate-binding protein